MRIDAGTHQLRGCRDNRVSFFGVNEVIQLRLANIVIACDFHHVFFVLQHLFWVEYHQRLAHPSGVVNIVAEDDGFIHRVGTFQIVGNGLRYQHGTFINHHRAVKIFQVVDSVFNLFAVFI
ncbi:hypothetical protein D3C76_1574370 [compost metagenome]